jgi:anti-sigma regulatory factor (Ser/Thr protein kinase)
MIRKQADLLLEKLHDSLRSADVKPFGDRGGGEFSLRLVRRPEAVALARHDLRRWLERDGVSREDALDIALACSEASANAVEHAEDPRRPTFDIEARRSDGKIELIVRDSGRWSEPPAAGGSRGRGLRMIRAIMDEVEVTPGPAGTQVVMRRSLGRDSD